jgi:hypothetical protein
VVGGKSLVAGLYLSALVALAGVGVVLACLPRPLDVSAEPPPRTISSVAGRGITIVEATLHAAHLRGAEPIGCADCHTIDPDGFAAPSRERCLTCHPAREAALHAAVDDPKAQECTHCHDFQDGDPTAVRAWQCGTCHEPPHGDQMSMSDDLSKTCGTCHTPHGRESLAPTACIGCHEDRATAHQTTDDPGTGSCLACHRQHDDARAAADRCAECHRGRERHVPATAIFAGGHDRCTGCHQPHVFSKKSVAACTSCHEHQRALAADRVPAHAACSSCHDRHAVRTAREACAGCHAKVSPAHPAAGGSDCLGCHPAHPERGDTPVAVVACSSCHRTAGSDRAFHRGARCGDCHEEHQFKLTARPALCLGCHAGRVGGSAAVATSTGHAECSNCHGTDPHDPATPPKCGTCHGDQAKSAPAGHATCTECHDQHAGKLRPRVATCTPCHADRLAGPHRGVDGGCVTCHRAHGPDGVASPPACATCHDRNGLPLMHQQKGHATCTDCHQPHAPPPSGRDVCLRCHTDRRDHEPDSTSCTSCHPFTGESR